MCRQITGTCQNPLVHVKLTKRIWGAFLSSDNPVPRKGISTRMISNPEHETKHKNLQGFGRYFDSLDAVAKMARPDELLFHRLSVSQNSRYTLSKYTKFITGGGSIPTSLLPNGGGGFVHPSGLDHILRPTTVLNPRFSCATIRGDIS